MIARLTWRNVLDAARGASGGSGAGLKVWLDYAQKTGFDFVCFNDRIYTVRGAETPFLRADIFDAFDRAAGLRDYLEDLLQ
jgi:hypothetical protein